MIVGVISDTHGLLRPEAIAALRGSEAIIHAGDVGREEILRVLKQIAPLTAVRGNIDTSPWARKLPATDVLEIAGASIYVLHNIDELDLDPSAGGFSAVIFGHSHRPLMENRKGVLFFNPGSAGPRRFNLPISVGRLIVENGRLMHELIELTGK
ncbi:MAG TPA: metallophosphoesterase family protein [Terriglobales bacterium]|nr:metallophosphoesterase family protein [Terriglobales bacterium]